MEHELIAIQSLWHTALWQRDEKKLKSLGDKVIPGITDTTDPEPSKLWQARAFWQKAIRDDPVTEDATRQVASASRGQPRLSSFTTHRELAGARGIKPGRKVARRGTLLGSSGDVNVWHYLV